MDLPLASILGQTFEPHDLAIVLLLVVLEGVLSVDNALVLSLLAKRLPADQRAKGLSYGLVGAFVFRGAALAGASFLLKWTVFKLVGGLYLLWVAFKHFVIDRNKGHDTTDDGPGVLTPTAGGFWRTVAAIELTDIAFAIDSIVAAIGVVGPPPKDSPSDAVHPKLWVVLTGGFLGVVLMRFAAAMFVKLLERFPRFETAAYLLVTLIALKLLVDYAAHTFDLDGISFHDPHSVAFWAFWVGMAACLASGFFGKKATPQTA